MGSTATLQTRADIVTQNPLLPGRCLALILSHGTTRLASRT